MNNFISGFLSAILITIIILVFVYSIMDTDIQKSSELTKVDSTIASNPSYTEPKKVSRRIASQEDEANETKGNSQRANSQVNTPPTNEIITKDKNNFKGITDFEKSFSEEDYDFNWAPKIASDITDKIIYKNGISVYPAIEVQQLDCRSKMCVMEFSRNTDRLSEWDSQRTELLYSLLELGKTGTDEDPIARTIKTKFLSEDRIRYYISRTDGDLDS